MPQGLPPRPGVHSGGCHSAPTRTCTPFCARLLNCSAPPPPDRTDTTLGALALLRVVQGCWCWRAFPLGPWERPLCPPSGSGCSPPLPTHSPSRPGQPPLLQPGSPGAHTTCSSLPGRRHTLLLRPQRRRSCLPRRGAGVKDPRARVSHMSSLRCIGPCATQPDSRRAQAIPDRHHSVWVSQRPRHGLTAAPCSHDQHPHGAAAQAWAPRLSHRE